MAEERLQHFLLVFNHATGDLDELREFGTDTKSAMKAYAECEELHFRDDLVEVVLLGADSLETVKVTHANYFDGTAALGGSALLRDAYELLSEVRHASNTGGKPSAT